MRIMLVNTMKKLLLLFGLSCSYACSSSLPTYRNGYILDTRGKTIGHYANGYIEKPE